MLRENEKIYEKIKYFKNINEKTYQLLGWLGFNLKEIINTNSGKWELYTKENFKFPYFYSEFIPSINEFCAIFKNSNEFIVCGSFEKIENVKEHLIKISDFFLKKEKKFLGIPLTLTEENAQDYGYIRGLILGFSLMIIDFLYSLIFKLKNGIITGFIDYVKVIYYGTPGFGLFVGITGTGLYFIFLLIILPILFGTHYKKLATKKILKNIEIFMKEIKTYNYEFGVDAEKTLEDEFTLIKEEKKKQQIYNELNKEIKISKNEFEILYEKLKGGFLKIDDLLNFINEYKKIFREYPLEKFLQVIKKYETAKIETDIKFQT
ncbi:MAG: hypothetical protein ACP5OB_05795 [Candidatus Ratteibacteria bacterium]